MQIIRVSPGNMSVDHTRPGINQTIKIGNRLPSKIQIIQWEMIISPRCVGFEVGCSRAADHKFITHRRSLGLVSRRVGGAAVAVAVRTAPPRHAGGVRHTDTCSRCCRRVSRTAGYPTSARTVSIR